MTSAKWLMVPTRLVRIDELIATQPGIYFHGLSAERHVGGDELPHVIEWDGELYLEDGHHRAVRARLSGMTHMEARVLRADV
jgi:Arc/MetJ family transcription regulator